MPVLPSATAVLVTGDFTPLLRVFFESHQLASAIKYFTVADIIAGKSAVFPHTDALVISDFREVDRHDRTVLIRLLGCLRDRTVANLFHLVLNSTLKPEWSMGESLAMGFIRRDFIKSDAMNGDLYEFKISSYKTNPDWLNSRDWAHPDLWR